MLLKPRLGRRRCSGIWPPSKPRFWLKPVPACWPLWPRALVFPWPEPMPRPTRFLAWVWPFGGLISLRFIVDYLLFDYRKEVRDLLHHPAKHGRIRPLHHLVELAQTQARHHPLVLLGGADRAADQFDFDCIRHETGSPYNLSIGRPRLSATWFLSRSASSATIVA